MDIDAFIRKTAEYPLPQNPMARVRTLAKELAQEVIDKLWNVELYAFRGEVTEDNYKQYIAGRWGDDAPSLALLVINGYLTWNGSNGYVITKEAFALLDAAEPATIFISYRRQDSSAFALLVLARLKAAGLNAFVDMTIRPGDDWQADLQGRIATCDYFVVLLGPHSLESEVVQREITWALQNRRAILPIWHGGFKHQLGQAGVAPETDDLLQNTHTIRVLEESALGYNNAIVELLNRFGVTP